WEYRITCHCAVSGTTIKFRDDKTGNYYASRSGSVSLLLYMDVHVQLVAKAGRAEESTHQIVYLPLYKPLL
ncbi:MAG: hypothetical protein ACR2H1_02665, partial [Limisphaerales bacterium]